MRYVILLLCLFLACPFVFSQQAKVIETECVMGTYDFDDPNPVPEPDNLYYPYFRFDGFTDNKVDKKWKTVELENDYIKVTLFPEIGGKVWGATDKVNGKEFIYHNHVVKFRDIAMRGPWVSGGIEFNFGIIGHAPTSASPVDYITKEKPDGSVSCYISSFEFITRTMWTVEVNLPKDKAYFSTNVTWYNNSSVDQPYYQWMNAGYKAEGNAQFCYPGTKQISHGGEVYPFPIDETGHNLSWYNNLNFGKDKSYHVLGKYNDFYGIFWHDDNHGSIHHSAYDEKLGMKIFLWSLSREGTIWEDLLTDNDGQYIELQSGRMYNQPATNSGRTPFKHAAFQAGQTDSWNEFWYPVADTKGVVKASQIGALNVLKEDDSLKLLFSPLQDMSASIRLYLNDKEFLSESVNFRTLSVWTKSIPLTDEIRNGNLKIIIGDNDLVYSEDKEDNVINRPMVIPADFDWQSVYGLYTSGEQWMNQKIFDRAETDLKAALSKDKYFAPAIVRLASLYYQLGRYSESLELCRRALALDTYAGEANYLYGLCNTKLGKYTDAKDGFSVATYSQPFRTAGYAKLSGMFIRDKNWNKAIEYAEKSLQFNTDNLEALHELLICYRKSGKNKEFEKLCAELLDKFPLDHYIRYEKYRNSKSSDSRKEFTALIRNELPQETYMELACWYESIGCFDDAIELFSFASEHPIACYQKAYILHQQGRESEAMELVEYADRLSPIQIFAFRPENLDALVWASTVSRSWKPAYYQAMVCHNLGNKNKALELLNSCGESDYMPFYLYRASLKKGEQRLMDLKLAESLNSNWRVGVELIKYYTSISNWKEANSIAKTYNKSFPENYIIGLQYARTLSETGQYDACISLLDKIHVLPNEGAYAGRSLYRDANLYNAINHLTRKKYDKAKIAIERSKLWNENLGVGKPYDNLIDYRLEDYIEALASASNSGRADQLFESIAASYDANRKISSTDLLTALSLRKIGKESTADQWVESWKKNYPGNAMIEWCISTYKGQNKEVDNTETRKNKDDDTPWEKTESDYNFSLLVKLFNSIDSNN